jgi:hypothetical protein
MCVLLGLLDSKFTDLCREHDHCTKDGCCFSRRMADSGHVRKRKYAKAHDQALGHGITLDGASEAYRPPITSKCVP